ncbi:MAG: hypothetical protein GY939_24585 [Actinomycetia bacterium]|nr:hypothetical protein [Actinomycetes bacterium]
MSDKDTATRDTGPTTGESGDEAVDVGEMCRGFAEMCRGFPEMRGMMMGEMPDCCRPEASEESGGSQADEASSRKATT